jgi:hypothetical protein
MVIAKVLAIIGGKHAWRFLASLSSVAYSLIVICSLVIICVLAQVSALERGLKLHHSGRAAEHYRFLVEKIQCLFYGCQIMVGNQPLLANLKKTYRKKLLQKLLQKTC